MSPSTRTVSESDLKILTSFPYFFMVLTTSMKAMRNAFLALAVKAIMNPVATSANRKNIVEPS